MSNFCLEQYHSFGSLVTPTLCHLIVCNHTRDQKINKLDNKTDSCFMVV